MSSPLQVSTPSSSRYGQLMTLEEVNHLVEPSPEAVVELTSFLTSQNITSVSYHAGFLRAIVTIAQAEKLLHTQYASYQHVYTGAEVLRCLQYSLPDHIHRHVDFVAPTTSFPAFPIPTIAASDDTEGLNNPDTLRTLYNVPEDAWGGASDLKQGVTAFLHQYYTESDLQSFYATYFPALYGTPIAAVVGVNEDKAGVEASLDVEYMTSLGSGVPTEFWSFAGRQYNNTANEPFLHWLIELTMTDDAPLVFSTSYGEDEASVAEEYSQRVTAEFQRQSLRGISFLFASGDSGVGSAFGPCTTYTPQFPADSPYVTAVGATTGTNPETGASFSSGGFSNRWATQPWQADAVAAYLSENAASLPDSSLYNSSGRGFPDVSAQGTGYAVINGGMTLPGVAGTSCSSPTFGGIISLINDQRMASGKSPLGFLNPFLYANADIFTDVTSGNNPGCSTPGFSAAAGWDPITGLGTPDYQKLLQAALALP